MFLHLLFKRQQFQEGILQRPAHYHKLVTRQRPSHQHKTVTRQRQIHLHQTVTRQRQAHLPQTVTQHHHKPRQLTLSNMSELMKLPLISCPYYSRISFVCCQFFILIHLCLLDFNLLYLL